MAGSRSLGTAALRNKHVTSRLANNEAAVAKSQRGYCSAQRHRFDKLEIADGRKAADGADVARTFTGDICAHRSAERTVGAVGYSKPGGGMGFDDGHRTSLKEDAPLDAFRTRRAEIGLHALPEGDLAPI